MREFRAILDDLQGREHVLKLLEYMQNSGGFLRKKLALPNVDSRRTAAVFCGNEEHHRLYGSAKTRDGFHDAERIFPQEKNRYPIKGL